MGSSDLVSICIPVLNGAKFLHECFESIAHQEYQNIQVLVSDDGSKDGSMDLIRESCKKLNFPFPLKTFYNKGLGISKNCNFLAKKSDGNLLKFLFQDDLIEFDFVSKHAARFLDSTSISFSFSDRKILNLSNNSICKQILDGCSNLASKWNNLEALQSGWKLLEDENLLIPPYNKIGEPSNVLVSREKFMQVGGFNEELFQLLDIDLWYKLMACGDISYINESLSIFRLHEHQETVKNVNRNLVIDEEIILLRSFLENKCYQNLSSSVKKRIINELTRILNSNRVPLKDFVFVKDCNKKLVDEIGGLQNHLKECYALQEYATNISKEIVLLKKEKNYQNQILSQKLERLNFMESTFVWKFRRFYMKFYYFYFWLKNQFKKDLNINNTLAVGTIEFQGYEEINYPKFTEIDFSIIIPYFGNYEDTYKCLYTIRKSVIHISYEIILVDDNSPLNQEFDKSIKNVLFIRNKENLGFLKSCNTAAFQAKGKILVFLNNDTQVGENWLKNIKDTFDSIKKVGVIGSKLLYPDGRLQEAGGIIWKDASGDNYGKLQNPNKSEFNFVREVDYCSGASFATPRELFLNLGGFDEDFMPAYYEDTDYCFRVRKIGLSVIYQPNSVVYHFEGLTSGTDLEKGPKASQLTNQKIFRKKWFNELETHYKAQDSFLGKYKAANKHGCKKMVLIIDSYVPCFDRESGSNRIFNIIKVLKNLNFHVIFFPDNQFGEQPYTEIMQQLGVEVICQEFCDNDSTPLKELLKRLPLLSIAWISRPQLFDKYYKHLIPKKSLFLIYDTVDLHFLRTKRQWEIEKKSDKKLKKKWQEYFKLERKCCSRAHLTITVTEEESKIIRDWGFKTAVVPNIHDTRKGQGLSFQDRSGLLFIGSYLHPPNVDAVFWLCEAIMPIIWKFNSEITLTLLGSNPTHEVLSYETDKIKIPGYIENVESYFDSAKVFVAPLRYGAGMKGKIGQSLAFGLPVVTTSIGAEGMDLENGKDALIAEDHDSMAESVLSIYEDKEKWSSLSSAGLRHIQKFSSQSVSESISHLLNS